jgi:minor extracellular serine protease Vpr
MDKIDRSLLLEIEGVPTDPKVPKNVPVGNYLRIILSYENSLQPMLGVGFLPGLVMNGIATGIIPTAALNQLESLPNVKRIDKDYRLNYALDASRVDVKANKFQKPPVDAGVMAYDGTGVIVGVIDNGFDYRHRSLRKGDGTGGTRILRFWDQRATPWQPNLNYGKKYDQAEIDAALTGYADPAKRLAYTTEKKHGNHVTGIAAGSGWIEDGGSARQYIGIAPGADLILVSHAGDETGGLLAEAVAYIAQQAQMLGKRCVINMSLGSTGYASDGFSPMDRCMDAVADMYPDVILVAAAGNSGNWDLHREGEVTAQPLHIPLRIWGDDCVVYIWYAGTENFALTVTPPPTSGQGPKTYDPTKTPHKITWPSGNRVTVTSELHEYNDKRRMILVFDAGNRDGVAHGEWTLTLTGPPQSNGKVHAWIDFDLAQSQRMMPRFPQATPDSTMESPGCADKVIAVGSYVTVNTKEFKPAVGSLSFFSSRGPLLDNEMMPTARIKPDICAPGQIVRSSTSRFIQEKDAPVVSGFHVETGTSMACPHVVGVIALLLEKESDLDPPLTRQQVYDRITQNARSDDFTGPVPNSKWGYGKLDAWGALFPALQSAGGPEPESIVAQRFRQPLKDLGDSMARSIEGSAYLEFFTRYRDEVIALIRAHRRIAVAWLRCGAPVVNELLKHLLTPDVPLPSALYGRSLRSRLRRFIRALSRYGGDEMKAALARLGDPLPADGLTMNQIRARLSGFGGPDLGVRTR